MLFKKCLVFILMAFLFAGAAVIPPEEPQPLQEERAEAAQPHWFNGWYEGAEGYVEAVAEYEKTDKPMAVYIDVDWCPYCRQFEKEVLSDPRVVAFMKDMIKVRLNPEKSNRANMIAFQYGVRGFPSFFAHPPNSGMAVKLYTGVSPQQFIAFFKEVLEL